MTNIYRIPRLEIPAQVAMTGGQVHSVTLFLGECAALHPGPERPTDLLNAGNSFIPVLERGNVVFLNVDNVLVVSVAADIEFAQELEDLDAALAQATHRRVHLGLEDGTTVRGDLTYLLPEGARRVQDFLNTKDRFVALRDGTLARLVNKRRIAWVTTN